MLTGTLPFGKLPGPEVVFRVVGGDKPSKLANALELGFSDKLWRVLEDCWKSDRTVRPSVKDVSSRVKLAASVCGTLSPVGAAISQPDDPESEVGRFGRSLAHSSSDVELIGLCRWAVWRWTV